MYECKNPYQFVKEHENDYLIDRGDKWYIRTYYAGVCEITKETFEKLEKRGMEVK